MALRQRVSGRCDTSKCPQFIRAMSKSKEQGNVMLLMVTLNVMLLFTQVDGAGINSGFKKDEVFEIEDFFNHILTCFDFPGMSVGVVRGDDTFATGAGLADWDTGDPVNAKTMFNLGSTAKAFVPYVLAEIMNGKGNNHGRLRWNRKLKDLLRTELDLDVKNSSWAEQTLREALLYSASGMPTTGPFPTSSAADMSTMAGLPKETTRADIVRRLVRFMPDVPGFQSSGHYSNLMYTVAAHLAERLTNTSWEQLVKEVVLDKNSMKDTHFTPAAMQMDDTAFSYFDPSRSLDDEGYYKQDPALFDLHPFEPVGSMMAPTSDVMKWLRHLLHNLYMGGSESNMNMLISDAFVHAVTAPGQEKQDNDSDVTLGYGMGWEVSEYQGRKRYAYTGNLYAFTTRIWLFPDDRTAVYVAINGHPKIKDDLAESQATILLGLNAILSLASDVLHREVPWINADDVCAIAGFDDEVDDDEYVDPMTYPAEEPVEESVDYPLPPDTYTGSYGHGLVGDFVVEVDHTGMLIVKLGRNLKGELRPYEGSSNKLMLKAVGWLQNTPEWRDDKVLEFLPASVSTGEQFKIIRLHLTEKLYYDFERGKMFSTMLVEAEKEEIRKAKEEEERRIREEVEAKQREEAARKAREEEERRRLEEIERKKQKEEKARIEAEKKEMMEAVAREEAEERARKEAEQKEMQAAVAREKAEEERKAQQAAEKAKNIQGQGKTAALEKTEDGDIHFESATIYNKANLVKKDDDLESHQSHQAYSESDDKTELEVLPPEKVTDIEGGKSKSENDGDKDGVGAGPVASTGILLMSVFVVFVQMVLHRN